MIRTNETQLRAIACECNQFDHVIQAMGYGYSLVNVSQDTFIRRCSDCVYWDAGHCAIFLREIKQYS